MKFLPLTVFCIIASKMLLGQQTTTNIPITERTAIYRLLSQKPRYNFLSTYQLDYSYLAEMQKSLGIEAPYYLKGDFNGDGASDFAIILAKDAAVKESDVDPPWRFRYRLAVAVFNGSAIGYTLSCFKEIESPLICFLRWEYDGGKGFFLGVYATDETYSFRPKAGTYVVE